MKHGIPISHDGEKTSHRDNLWNIFINQKLINTNQIKKENALNGKHNSPNKLLSG